MFQNVYPWFFKTLLHISWIATLIWKSMRRRLRISQCNTTTLPYRNFILSTNDELQHWFLPSYKANNSGGALFFTSVWSSLVWSIRGALVLLCFKSSLVLVSPVSTRIKTPSKSPENRESREISSQNQQIDVHIPVSCECLWFLFCVVLYNKHKYINMPLKPIFALGTRTTHVHK